MGVKEYKQIKEKKAKRSRTGPVLGALVVIAVIVVALVFYTRAPVSSNTVYCGVFQYLIFPAQSVIGSSTETVNETMTTSVVYTTTTSPAGPIGHTYSNSTTTTTTSGYGAGVETICKYISNTSGSSSSASSASP